MVKLEKQTQNLQNQLVCNSWGQGVAYDYNIKEWWLRMGKLKIKGSESFRVVSKESPITELK